MILLNQSMWNIRETGAKGKGVVATQNIPKGTLIAQYTGRIVPLVDVDLQKYKGYLMHYDDEHCIIPDLSKPGAHLINHSCDPNCWIFPYEKNTFFVSIRSIKKDQEVTIHYLYPPLEHGCNECDHGCHCGSSMCTGTMHTDLMLYTWWQNFLKR